MAVVPVVDLADDSFVAAPPAVVAPSIAAAAFWRSCWPGLELTAHHDRGIEGVRWYVRGALTGTAEVWLEPYWEGDGTLVHVFLRADPDDGRRRSAAQVQRLNRRYAVDLKRSLFVLKDQVEKLHAG
ncbi:hypothetical protein GCM10027569_45290 [Flindersiella endophytica]